MTVWDYMFVLLMAAIAIPSISVFVTFLLFVVYSAWKAILWDWWHPEGGNGIWGERR